jgi:phage terminase small subunit
MVMVKAATSKETIKKNTVRDMKSLGVYKPEYDPLIDVYSDLFSQYLRANKEFELSGFQYETETAAGGTKKSAIVATLESLRKDLLAYSDRLCLNPKAIQSVTTDTPKKSKLAEALGGF